MSKDTAKKIINRPMDLTGKDVGYLLDSLVRGGYLNGNILKGYDVTPVGGEMLLEFVQEREAIVRDTIRKLNQVLARHTQEMDKLLNGQSAVN